MDTDLDVRIARLYGQVFAMKLDVYDTIIEFCDEADIHGKVAHCRAMREVTEVFSRENLDISLDFPDAA